MTPKIKRGYQSTFHKDGSVSYWDIFCQRWSRQQAERISNNVLASMSAGEREIVTRMAAQSVKEM